MPRTLLLADDSVTIQKVVGISFANEDVRLVTVDNGDDALVQARELRPDLVLADVVMPGKSGYEVCESIKSDAGLRHIPVLLLSGTFEAFDDERAQRAGADGHITKPFEAQTLVDRVNQLLASAPGAASVQDASDEAPFDFFEDEAPVADAGETTVVASDDLEFGTGDEAFVFESGDPVADPVDPDPLEADLESPATDPWSSDTFRDRASSDPVADLGLDAPEDPVFGRVEADDPLLDSMPGDTSPADAVRALGLDAPLGSTSLDEPDDAGSTVAEREFDVSSSDLGETVAVPVEAPPAPAPPPVAAPPAAAPSVGAPPADAGPDHEARPLAEPADGIRAEVVDALEKIAWEAFGDLTEQLVKQTVAKVEAIAWEVIPEMAERLVREEIEKLKK